MRIAIDTKNLALYSGGIAAFLEPLITAWVAHRPDLEFTLVGPPFEAAQLRTAGNWKHAAVPWPERLPRSLRHPAYDLVLFPRAIRRLEPRLLFSPYHDVRLPPRSRGVMSVMTIHDTCLQDLADIYPGRIRQYYLSMLRLNLGRAHHILTVSETSRARILEHYRIVPERVSVVYNALDEQFGSTPDSGERSPGVRSRYAAAKLIFYAGGSEYRKNVGRLLDALVHLRAGGRDPMLLVTGTKDAGWVRALAGRAAEIQERVAFLGRLDAAGLAAHYAAADAVAYPTLCEGFGRVCLEAMAAGTPLACSDLPVLREVAGDYPRYFDPLDVGSIAAAITEALAGPRPGPRRDARFAPQHVAANFLALMDRLVDEARRRNLQ